MKRLKFDVIGMTCSSCQSHVERAVLKLNGINKAEVNLLLNNMVVEFNENLLDENTIIKAVRDAGYDAKISQNVKENNKKKSLDETKLDETNENIKSMKFRVIFSFCLLIPLMYVSMNHMIYMLLKIDPPKIIMKYLHGTENAITFAFLQLLLLLPIMYVNRSYFINGFKRLIKRAPNMDSLIALGSSASFIYGIFAIFMIGYGLRT